MKSASGFPSPGTGFFAVAYSGHRVHVAIAFATDSSDSRLGPRAPKRSREVVPTTMPTGASCPSTSGVDAGIPSLARTGFAALWAGAAPAARRVSRQSLGGGSSAAFGAGGPSAAPCGARSARVAGGAPPTMRSASSTLSWSSTSSRSPSSRRCSRYRRSCSLGSLMQQRLHAVEDLVCHRVLRQQRQRLLPSVWAEQGHAVRVDAETGARLTRIVHHHDVERLRLELLAAAAEHVVGLQGEADDDGILRARAARARENVWRRSEIDRGGR